MPGNVMRIPFTITGVDATPVITNLSSLGAPPSGTILRVTATADAAEDGTATVGATGAVDLSVQITESTIGFGVGRGLPGTTTDADGKRVANYPLDPLNPSLTVDSQENLQFFATRGPAGGLSITVAFDAGGTADGVVVGNVTIQLPNP